MRQKLRATVSHFLLEALSQGYPLSDVLRIIEEESMRWRSQQSSATEEENSHVIAS